MERSRRRGSCLEGQTTGPAGRLARGTEARGRRGRDLAAGPRDTAVAFTVPGELVGVEAGTGRLGKGTTEELSFDY